MDVNVKGRVANIQLARSRALQPLHEAIVNSIHSIEEEYGDASDGEIEIQVLRDPTGEIEDKPQYRRDIVGFRVIDNGVGFDSENFESFNTSDTTKKSHRGGKGVGRFLWLKAFEWVEVDSVFEDDSGSTRKRSFEFKLTEDGVENHQLQSYGGDEKRTEVTLKGLNESYRQHGVPKKASTISRRIIEHHLEHFVLDSAPKIEVSDDDEDGVIDLNSFYEDIVDSRSDSQFSINGKDFTLKHFLLEYNSNIDHKLHLCADMRLVDGLDLSNKIPNLVKPLPIQNGKPEREVVYNGYLTSDYLNQHVTSDRTSFTLGRDDFFGGDIEREQIEDTAIDKSESFLSRFLEPIKEEKRSKIRDYVNKSAPQYKHLLTQREDEVEEIPADCDEEELDHRLYDIHKDMEKDVRRKAKDILSEEAKDEEEEDIKEKYERFLEDWNAVGKSNLAKYIIHRKTNIELLDKRIRLGEDGDYDYEEAVHDLIFPLKQNSQEVDYEDHNLWILDEKLSFHEYLSSDEQFSQAETLDSDSNERPDLLVFDNPTAIVDEDRPYASVTVFEFKRPMRDDYYDEDPIDQVIGYVEELMEGNATDVSGRPINIRDRTPFYCYIVADLTPTLTRVANRADYTKTPDQEGYFDFNSNYNAYIEIMSYDKLLNDARKRNRILFHKLNLDEPIPEDA